MQFQDNFKMILIRNIGGMKKLRSPSKSGKFQGIALLFFRYCRDIFDAIIPRGLAIFPPSK
jgi:hypothetical protein